MSEKPNHHFAGMLALSLAIVLAALIAAGAVRQVKRAADTITVTGSAKQPIRSDYVIWRGSVAAQRPSLQEAYRDVQNHAQSLRRFLRDNQVPDSLVILKPPDTYQIPESFPDGRTTGRILAHNMRQTFEIRSSDVDGITALSARAADLINEGVQIELYPLEYYYTRLSDLRTEMLAQAAADARRRAESIAASVGSKIGPVRSARMGVFQITARNSTDVSDYGIYDTSSLEKDITAVVSITFAVQ